MDLFDVVRSCFRRWYVVLPLLLIAAWFAHDIYTSVKPVYYSNAVVSIFPPNTRVDQTADGSPVPRNGLLDVGGATLITNMAVIGMKDPSTVAQVVAAGGKANYRVRMYPVPATSPDLPLIMVDATQPDPASATKTVELAAAQVDPTVRALQQQASVPEDLMVKAFVVSPPSAPAAGMPSRTRSTVAIFIAGAGLAILFGVVVDMLIMRWKARRQKRRETRVQTADRAMADDSTHTDPRNKQAADEVAMDRR